MIAAFDKELTALVRSLVCRMSIALPGVALT